MLNKSIRNQIDTFWDLFWRNGINDSVSMVQQVTILLFLRDLQEKNQLFRGKYETLHWSVFREQEDILMVEILQSQLPSFIKQLENSVHPYTPFAKEVPLLIKQPKLLKEMVVSIDSIYNEISTSSASQGEMYDYVLRHLSTSESGGKRLLPTPSLAKTIIEMLSPRKRDVVFDPFCGTGIMLKSAIKDLRRRSPEPGHLLSPLFGYDTDPAMFGFITMSLHLNNLFGLIQLHRPKYADLVVTSCPLYANDLQHDILSRLKDPGKGALIIPDEVLSMDTHFAMTLSERFSVEAVIALPYDLFHPLPVKASLVLFSNKDNVAHLPILFCDLTNTHPRWLNNDLKQIWRSRASILEDWQRGTERYFRNVWFIDQSLVRKRNYSLLVHDYEDLLEQRVELKQQPSTPVVNDLKFTMKVVNINKHFYHLLSQTQQELYNAFSGKTLAIHEAAKEVAKKITGYGVQNAKSSVEVLEQFGLLERVPYTWPKDWLNAYLYDMSEQDLNFYLYRQTGRSND